ncbi:MAG: 2-oxoglutarate dehydrogenase E1 component [Bdellovibrionales bacterium]|nr:2-oxoglutarate dehydrogenase E1 component [Bdellovibrionales bacterium]
MAVNLNSENLEYIESLYEVYKTNPEELDEKWRSFFSGVDFASESAGGGISSKELNVYNLIQAYRDYGHFQANLDPLSSRPTMGDLSLKNFGLTEADLNSTFSVGKIVGLQNATLKGIIEHLQKSYCGTITAQVSDAVKGVREWFHNEMEKPAPMFDAEKKKMILQHLVRTESLEKFIHTRFVGTKRFSIEGADAMIPMFEHLTVKGRELGVEEIVIGMAHRGRVNVLTNFMDKGMEVILAQFDGHTDDIPDYDGDVKYHMGYSVDKKTPHGDCHISLAFNPSHLEAVNPVVCGMARAKQRFRKDTADRKKVVPVLVHGDAAFPGQGVVAETLQLAHLKGYTVGGTIHLIIDNQVGFTANAEETRSSPYSSDAGKTQQVPVIHVNGDDAEACVRAMDISIRFRQQFNRDVIVNIICYRRFGHNEGDEPAYTQPTMYQTIKAHPTPCEIYSKRLMQEKVIDAAYYEGFYKEKMDNLQKILDDVRKTPPKFKPQAFGGAWKGLRRPSDKDFVAPYNTGTPLATLKKVGAQLTTMPAGFKIHPKLQKLIDTRKEMVEGKIPVDWGMAELLSYGSTILEGNSVRLSGQDCVRGTFTHRHSCFYDFNTGEEYNPLEQLREDKEFCVYNSPLSEMAVLGFEYGNSSSDPSFLTIWEAQFGDFANGAQIIIDQFLASGEQKWMRMSGLTMLLPHGYEGQGPEHSSARLERFLQLCAQNNMQVVNMTTPAQLFHALRRQVKRDFRVPLIVMSPKSLLRHPKVISTMKELSEGRFYEVIPDAETEMTAAKKMVLVSGKLYYELLDQKEKLKAKDVALVRVEQLYPFPKKQLADLLKPAKKLEKIIWAQEEPKNMGAWNYICHPLQQLVDEMSLSASLEYIGRDHRASPATGTTKKHITEQTAIISEVFKK